MDHDYKSPRVQSKYIKQLKAILWVGGFYKRGLAHDDWKTISFPGFPTPHRLLLFWEACLQVSESEPGGKAPIDISAAKYFWELKLSQARGPSLGPPQPTALGKSEPPGALSAFPL